MRAPAGPASACEELPFGSLSQETFRRFLRQARTVDDVITLLEEADARPSVR